jgi:hypothetical protein
LNDTLFLLAPDFRDPALGEDRFYCMECAAVNGLLHFYPRLSDTLTVREVAFSRPRAEVAALLGPDHPGCPVLVLDPARDRESIPEAKSAATGRRYVSGSRDIAAYLARTRGIGIPHP